MLLRSVKKCVSIALLSRLQVFFWDGFKIIYICWHLDQLVDILVTINSSIQRKIGTFRFRPSENDIISKRAKILKIGYKTSISIIYKIPYVRTYTTHFTFVDDCFIITVSDWSRRHREMRKVSHTLLHTVHKICIPGLLIN